MNLALNMFLYHHCTLEMNCQKLHKYRRIILHFWTHFDRNSYKFLAVFFSSVYAFRSFEKIVGLKKPKMFLNFFECFTFCVSRYAFIYKSMYSVFSMSICLCLFKSQPAHKIITPFTVYHHTIPIYPLPIYPYCLVSNLLSFNRLNISVYSFDKP